MSGRAQMLEKAAGRIKGHALSVVLARVAIVGPEGRKVKTENGIVYTREYQKLMIDDDSKFIERHADTKWVKRKPSISKTDLIQALKNGNEIEGAQMVDAVSVVFR